MHATHPKYTLYVYDISYFSGKMEGYLRYKEIPHRRVEPSWSQIARDVHRNTGLMKLPVVKRGDGIWMQDSTPMIEWFEKHHPEPAILPKDPTLAFVSHLVEDYADEWMWRPALYYRWRFTNDAELYSRRFVQDFLYDWPLPSELVRAIAKWRQRRIYLDGDGVTPRTAPHIEGIYLRTLAQLSTILKETPFLLGARPSLADFGFFASMFRHFSIDPTPSRIMRDRAPRVYEWVARLWATRASDLDVTPQDAWPEELPETWGPLLREIGQTYLPYLQAMASAHRRGDETFDVTIQEVPYKGLPVVPYRLWCLDELQRRLIDLPDPHAAQTRRLLDEHGCMEPLLGAGRFHSQYYAGRTPPICRPVRLGRLEWLKGFVEGTSWDKIATW